MDVEQARFPAIMWLSKPMIRTGDRACPHIIAHRHHRRSSRPIPGSGAGRDRARRDGEDAGQQVPSAAVVARVGDVGEVSEQRNAHERIAGAVSMPGVMRLLMDWCVARWDAAAPVMLVGMAV